jgi:hypothetical protein
LPARRRLLDAPVPGHARGERVTLESSCPVTGLFGTLLSNEEVLPMATMQKTVTIELDVDVKKKLVAAARALSELASASVNKSNPETARTRR